MKHVYFEIAVLTVVLGSLPFATSTNAQDAPAAVTSWTDGQGHYTYTFSHSNCAAAWLFGTLDPDDVSNTTLTAIWMRHMTGVTNTVLPQGWAQITAPESKNDIWWVYTNGTYTLQNTSVTFSVYSVWTNATVYSPTNTVAAYTVDPMVCGAVKVLSSAPGDQEIFAGYQRFSYIGMRFPHIESIHPRNGSLAVAIGDTCGATCRVETASSLQQGDWKEVMEVPAFSGSTNVVLPNLGGSARFVRFRSK